MLSINGYPLRILFCTFDAKVSKDIEKRPNDRRCLCCRGDWRPRGSGVRNIGYISRFILSDLATWSRTD